ncbi:MAG: 50S ribosomal protein L9 [Burkholderiaceae bacterium]|jgi:large subunit ribosomal protein L9
MQIILLEKIDKKGSLGDIIRVKNGFARNYLIPTGKARRATQSAIAEFEARRADLEKAAAQKLADAHSQRETLSTTTVHVSQKAGVDGRLFGSVTNGDIAEALKAKGFKVDKSQIRLTDGPLKLAGEHTVAVQLHSDVSADLKVIVVGEAA